MALLLYTIVAAAILAIARHHLSRWSALLLYLLPFTFTGYALVTGGVYGPIDHPYATVPLSWMRETYGIGGVHNGALSDLYMQMIPWRRAVQVAWAQGQWPLWNPFLLSGDILAQAAQPAPYSPLTLVALLVPVAQSLTFSATLAHFLAALGAYLLARELGCREAAALVAAAGFTFATGMNLFILWPLGVSWVWLPWTLFAVRRGSFPLLTTIFTLLLLSGHPETSLHVVFVAAVWWLTISRKKLPVMIAAGVTALLLAAIFLLPIFEAAPQTMEHAHRQTVFANVDRGAPAVDVFARVATDVFPYLHLRKIEAVGLVPFDSAAVGSIILTLALYAATRIRSRETWFFTAIALFGLLARGGWKPLAALLQKLPLFDVALNERFSFAAACSLAMLAALGVEELLRREGDRSALAIAAAVLVVLVAGNVWILQTNHIHHDALGWGRWKVAAEVAGLALAIVAIWRRNPALLLGLVLAQRVLSDGGIYRTFPAKAAYPPIAMFEPMREVREPFRITGHGNAMIPGTSTLYGLEDVRGYQAMTFRRYFETYPLWSRHQPVWYNRVDDLTKPFLSFLNVRYAITWDRDPPPPGWREAARQRGSLLLENTRVLPRAFLPRLVRLNAKNVLQEMHGETDFAERAWIEAGDERIVDAVNGRGRIEALGADGFTVAMESPGWVVTSIPRWSGWRAYVDGRRVDTHFANHAFLAVHVDAGRHRVRLSYWPRSFVVGRAISAATLLALIAWSVARRFVH